MTIPVRTVALSLPIDERRAGGHGTPRPPGPRDPAGGVVRIGNIRNVGGSPSSPRRSSLRTASGDATVAESSSSPFALPRAAAAGVAAAARTRQEHCRPCIRRVLNSWLIGARATGLVMQWESLARCDILCTGVRTDPLFHRIIHLNSFDISPARRPKAARDDVRGPGSQ